MTREELVQALALIDEPEMPQDGDCLRMQPRITKTLREQGWGANLMTVLGWVKNIDPDLPKVIAFAHQATECEGWTIDFTARMFNDALPARWIIPTNNYAAELASMAKVEKVTLHWEPGSVIVRSEGP